MADVAWAAVERELLAAQTGQGTVPEGLDADGDPQAARSGGQGWSSGRWGARAAPLRRWGRDQRAEER